MTEAVLPPRVPPPRLSNAELNSPSTTHLNHFSVHVGSLEDPPCCHFSSVIMIKINVSGHTSKTECAGGLCRTLASLQTPEQKSIQQSLKGALN